MLTSDRVMIRLVAGAEARAYASARREVFANLVAAHTAVNHGDRMGHGVLAALARIRLRDVAIRFLGALQASEADGGRTYHLADRRWVATDNLISARLRRLRSPTAN
jgi:hypothetical protein